MPVFIDPKEDNVVLANYKVMYSSIRYQDNFIRVGDRDIAKFAIQRYLKKDGIDVLIIVRNPYDRLESFFKEKLRKNVHYNEKWQSCQRIFFAYIGVSEKDSDEKIKRALKSITFHRFIDLLPKLYDKDKHLKPQHNRLWLSIDLGIEISLPFKINGAEIVKLENMKKSYMLEKWNINTEIQKNETKKNIEEWEGKNVWSNRCISIVNEIYKKDFFEFGYEMK